jgi:uncharacterized membrane protein YraQ (UPF0718 family)
VGEFYKRLLLDFSSIIYEALPFIVLGVVLAGLLEEFVPQQFMSRVMPKSRFLGIGLGALLGSIFPMCECGIVVVMRRLLRKGLPLSVCISYMLAGPIINIVVLTSTYVAFNPLDPSAKTLVLGGPVNVVLLRAGLGFIVAYFTALCVEWQFNKYGNALLSPTVLKGVDHDDGKSGPRSWWDRLNNISGTALNDFVDIMAFLILGAMLAAIGKGLLRGTEEEFLNNPNAGEEIFLQQYPYVAILIMMGLAIAFCLCSEADAFVAANFSMVWPPASKIAFLVLGPMLDFKLLMMFTRVFRLRLILTIVTALLVQVFAYSMFVHYFESQVLEFLEWVKEHAFVPAVVLVGLIGAETAYQYYRHAPPKPKDEPQPASGETLAQAEPKPDGQVHAHDHSHPHHDHSHPHHEH